MDLKVPIKIIIRDVVEPWFEKMVSEWNKEVSIITMVVIIVLLVLQIEILMTYLVF